MPPAGAGGIGVAKCEVGQEALGAASDGAASDGADDSVPVDGSRLGAERLGDVVAAGVLQATTAPPTETARARASRIRLNMMSGPPLRDELRRCESSASGSVWTPAWVAPRVAGATTRSEGSQRG